MADLLHSESNRLYSWWWDSHISPKNSKWLQENLTDMDAKVKAMIKLIEEDADSFARRAEMYYKKRPELMKFVEEFYRAYRALAERYNHAMGELHHAHRTIAKAFPDQVPFELIEESPSKTLEFPIHGLFNIDDNAQGLSGSNLLESTPGREDLEVKLRNSCLKHLPEMLSARDDVLKSSERVEKDLEQEKGTEERFHDEVLQLSNDRKLKENVLQLTEREGESESEVQSLKKALVDMEAVKADVLLQHQQCLTKLSTIERELSSARMDSMTLNEKSSRAEIEVKTLKEALIQLEAEKNAGATKHMEYLEKICNLEAMLSRLQEENKGLNTRATEADLEVQALRDEILRLQLEKDMVLHQYNQCLQTISDLEGVISVMENGASLIKKEAERSDNEVSELKKSLADLTKERDTSALQYKRCLETLSNYEKDISNAKNDVNRLSNDVLVGNLKLKNAEAKCNLLEVSNQSLQAEADILSRNIAVKDKELSEKQQELESLQSSLQDQHLHHAHVEETLQTLQHLHSQSQDDQRTLVEDLKKALKMLKDLEVSKHDLEEEIRQVQDENQSLSHVKAVSLENMQNEIHSLKEIKERLEKEVTHQIGLSDSLQEEIVYLKREIKGLNRSYQAIIDQIQASGLKPDCLGASVKSLHDENSELRKIYEQDRDEREILSKKLENMQELFDEKAAVESSLLDLNSELERSQEKVKALQESCQFLDGEKATLVTEKSCLLSQLQATTENMHKLLEKNAVLENSLSIAKISLEGLSEKSKALETICELLKNERSYLLTERGTLAVNLENVEKRLENMEKKYMGLEEKYANLEKEKGAVHCQVEELKVSLSVEKQERTSSHLHCETRLSGLENQIHLLEKENTWKKREYTEELEKCLKAQFEISVLQKIIKDMEEKNASLIIECQKHVEASKLAEKLISELESESLEQQAETELLLDEIERLRFSLYQVFRALGSTAPDCDSEDKIENVQIFVQRILGIIQDMKHSVSVHEDDRQLMLFENSVLLTLLEQLETKVNEIESQKLFFVKEFKHVAENLDMARKEKDKLLELNGKAESDLSMSLRHAVKLEAELESLSRKQDDSYRSFKSLEDAYLQVNQINKSLLKKFSDLKQEKYQVEQLADAALQECLTAVNESEVFRNFGEEKVTELHLLLSKLNSQYEVNGYVEREMWMLLEKLKLQKSENLPLKDIIHTLEREILGLREDNVQMKRDVLSSQERLQLAEGNHLAAEVKLEVAENLNFMLCQMVDELKTDVQESRQLKEKLETNIVQLSENNSIQVKDFQSLQAGHRKLVSEISQLHGEIKEKTSREQTLHLELQEKKNEFELWEAEAAAFYSGLQITSVQEVIFRTKVLELSEFCWTLQNESSTKTSEIEQMKEKNFLMEHEISKLKSHLHSYGPIIDALKDDIIFLERNALLQTKPKATHNPVAQILEADSNRSTPDVCLQDQSLVSLQNFQRRIKAVGKLMGEANKPAFSRRVTSSVKQESATGEIERLKPLRCLGRDKNDHRRRKGHGNEPTETPKLQKIKTKAPDVQNATHTKDIPLDQASNSPQNGTHQKDDVRTDDKMLELWESSADSRRDLTIGDSHRLSYKISDKDIVYDHFKNANHKSDPPSTDSDVEKESSVDSLAMPLTRSPEHSREVTARRILVRLASDAVKLKNIQTTVDNLRKKLESNKTGSRPKNDDFETIEDQLLDAEETIIQLMDLNDQLVNTIEKCPSPVGKASPQLKESIKTRRRKAIEQARKGSETIARLQLELQKIQHMLLKMEEEKKNKVRNKFFRSKTIVLRDFMYNGRKSSAKRKKGPMCGCFRPSTSRSECSQ